MKRTRQCLCVALLTVTLLAWPRIRYIEIAWSSSTSCAELASDLHDPDRIGTPVPNSLVPLGQALLACRSAVSETPRDARSHYYLGRVLELRGDASTAFAMYERSARLGYRAAFSSIGRAYQLGAGVETSFSRASEYYERAYKLGAGSGAAAIGEMYYRGVGRPLDFDAAVEWWRKGATLNDAASMALLGYAFVHAVAVEQSYESAYHWFLRAAQKGEPHAALGLSRLLEFGMGAERDVEAAFRWKLFADRAGLIEGMRAVGIAYLRGRGATPDEVQARTWLSKAADMGDAAAQVYLQNLDRR